MTIKIITDADTYTIDQSIRVQVEGVTPGTDVTFVTSLIDDENVEWRSEALFTVPEEGTLDINNTAPKSGSWSGVDMDGFLWTLAPCAEQDFDDFRLNGNLEVAPNVPSSHRIGRPTFLGDNPATVTFSVCVDGQELTSKTLVRHRFHPDVRESEVKEGRLVGAFFEPANSTDNPGVIILSGSEGGIKREFAALLSSKGFSVLALGYFNAPGLPLTHVRIPFEYFREGIDWLSERIGHDRIGILGGSRGGEAVLAIASIYPEKVRAVIAEVPGDLYGVGETEAGVVETSWTLEGKDLPCGWDYNNPSLAELVTKNAKLDTTDLLFGYYSDPEIYEKCAIPLENMRCPVLFISGEDDRVWPSYFASCRAVERLEKANYEWPVEHIWEADAGHIVAYPGYPTVMGEGGYAPSLPLYIVFGGTPSGSARVQRRAWDRTVEFFSQHLADAKNES